MTSPFGNTLRLAAISAMLVIPVLAMAAPAHAESVSHLTLRVVNPDGDPLPRIPITLFKNNGTGTYTQVGIRETDVDGKLDTLASVGSYKIAVNKTNVYRDASLFYRATYGTGAATLETSDPFEIVADASSDLGDLGAEWAGGVVAGRAVDYAGIPVPDAEVIATDMSAIPGPDPDADYTQSRVTRTDAEGRFEARTGAGTTKVSIRLINKFVRSTVVDPNGYTTFELEPDDRAAVPDVVLHPSAIVSLTRPTVYGTVSVGKTLYAKSDVWSPVTVTKKYQWYYLKSGSIRAISGATRSSIALHSTDYGKQFRVRVTASYPGTASKAVTSSWSVALRRNSSVSISGSSPSRGKVKLAASVDAVGAKATGKVRFTCATSAAIFASKTVTLSSEKASATFYNLPKSKMTCKASYSGTSTIKSSSRSKTIYVK